MLRFDNSANTIDLSNVVLTGIEQILAGAGADQVRGSSGDDVIVGGTGNDVLEGGFGDDTFLIAGRTGATPSMEARGSP